MENYDVTIMVAYVEATDEVEAEAKAREYIREGRGEVKIKKIK